MNLTIKENLIDENLDYGFVVPKSLLSRVPYSVALLNCCIPLDESSSRLSVLVPETIDSHTLQNLQTLLGRPIRPKYAPREQILALIAEHYGVQGKESRSETLSDNTIPEATRGRLAFNPNDTTITIVDDIIHEAIRLRASDIHFEPFEYEMIVRFRIDGVLQEMMSVPKDRVLEVTSRIKIIAGMDIAEKRRAQDGKIRINEKGLDVDIRVSAMPTDFGEKIVLRLLDKGNFDYSIETLGLEPKRLSLFKRSIQQPNGIVLITGPTGSGKSTTLYGAINYLKKPGINISTVEDPIEYNIPGVNQVQVNQYTGMTFSHTLRTLLRQDPDIIMLGEMRDKETAEIAIRSSLTGHLVLSTLHTNDAASAVTRLVDMGIEPYLVASSLNLIVAQRLVRKICPNCNIEETNREHRIEGIPDRTFYKGLGCQQCGYTGYRGRIGIFEVLPVSEEIRTLIKEKVSVSDIRKQAELEGLVSLRENAIGLLCDGQTSLEEVLREVSFVM